MKSSLPLPLVILPMLLGAETPQAPANFISSLERDAGWVLLFDGESTQGWKGLGRDEFPAKGWNVEGGCLHHVNQGGGGDIMTTEAFGDFELEFEWRVSKAANSGVKYRVQDGGTAYQAFGPEYQVLDDERHLNGMASETSAGALYDLVPAGEKTLAPITDFNRGRIVSAGGRIEHWLNGQRVLEIDLASERWRRALADSKFSGTADFGRAPSGHIALQDHGDEVWFRSIKLRSLPAPASNEVSLLRGFGLDQWYEYGDARYVLEDDEILGEVKGGGQSFLLSKRAFGDFIFEVDVKNELPGNSGIQIRSHEKDNGRPFGYQVEIDPSDRSWSGGLYDEARRAWLQNLNENPAGRAAFQRGEWNRFRIECFGPWIRVNVNGIPTTDYFDTYDVEGRFGLQVHSGNNTRVRWRRPRVWDFGTRAWHSAMASNSAMACTPVTGEWQVTPEEITGVSGRGPLAILRIDGMPGSAGDYTMRGEFLLEAGTFHILARRCARMRGTVEGRELLTREGDSWRIVPTATDLAKAGEWNEFSVCLDGDRIVVLVNGRRAADERGPIGTEDDELLLMVVGPASHIRLRDIEFLGDV